MFADARDNDSCALSFCLSGEDISHYIAVVVIKVADWLVNKYKVYGKESN